MVKNKPIEEWIPWVSLGLIVLMVFPYDKIKEYFTPEPVYIQVPVQVPVKVPVHIPVPIDCPTCKAVENVPKLEEKVCVFEVINCGDLGPCVKVCKELGCRLAINTLRTIDNTDDLKMEETGFTAPHYDSSDYYYNQSTQNLNFDELAKFKLDNLKKIQNKYNIKDRSRIVLVDDNMINTRIAQEEGFSAVRTGTKNPGVQEEDIKQIIKILTM